MKLRNRQSGEIKEFVLFDGKEMQSGLTLENLAREWEDYEPVEPLIKDEKVRKAVRAWAEVNSRDLFRVINKHFNCCKIIGYIDGWNASCDKIEFGTTIKGADKDYYYTIAELCGEEEV